MKLADFFIGIRQLFGIVIPGLMWLACISLVVVHQDPLDQLWGLPVRIVVAFMAFAFMLGITFRRVSFNVGVFVSSLLHAPFDWMKKRKDARREPESGGQPQSPKTNQVYPQFKKLAQECLLCRHELWLASPTWKQLSEEDRGYIYKYVVLGQPELARRIEENEAEINLYATLVLPLLLLLPSLWIYWNASAVKAGFFGSSHRLWWACGILISTVLIAWRIRPRRIEEAAEWYRMFIALNTRRSGGDNSG